ncbi:thiamine-phosphate kinase [Mucilaginibacter sp. dw_454]|uniref:thiamine-phosphate kinase n=1 Tax=Mucilaginibacter sp. dw_454 TaxID=2720079 RepID=UPI001BD42ACB|nr:thiamine-phosphate kinase [Mucilaginibacter sp. dw_454]
MKSISNEEALFKIIGQIISYPKSQLLPVGVESMDDCALIKIDSERSMAVSSDFVRGSGFTLFHLGHMNYYDVGYYLISANLSDLASVGAKPIGLTTIVRYADMDDEDFRAVFQGMKDSADRFDVQIIGGDIGSYKADVFAATAMGIVDTAKALLRKNVRDGDLLCLTGTVGKPITALLYFKEIRQLGLTLTKEEEEIILQSWKRPEPRIKEGLILADNSIGNACQDVSDGLKGTIDQLSKASGKYFTIFENNIPIESATRRLAEFLNINPVTIAISASVDFELTFTIAKENKELCERLFSEIGSKLIVIGEVNNLGENIMIDRYGTSCPLPGVKFDQRPIQEIIKDIIKT